MATVTETWVSAIDDAAATTHTYSGVTIAAGKLAVVRGNYGSDTTTLISSITDSASNTWAVALVQASTGDGFSFFLGYSVLTSALSAGSVTINTSSIALAGDLAWFDSDSGWVAQASVLDKTHGNYASNTANWTSGATATTTQADELLVGGCVRFNVNGSTSTPSGSWTEESDRAVTHPAQGRAVSQWQHVSSTGAYACDGTWSVGAEFAVCGIATFKTAAGAAVVTNPVPVHIPFLRGAGGC